MTVRCSDGMSSFRSMACLSTTSAAWPLLSVSVRTPSPSLHCLLPCSVSTSPSLLCLLPYCVSFPAGYTTFLEDRCQTSPGCSSQFLKSPPYLTGSLLCATDIVVACLQEASLAPTASLQLDAAYDAALKYNHILSLQLDAAYDAALKYNHILQCHYTTEPLHRCWQRHRTTIPLTHCTIHC